jgi:hypothetical protein
VKVRVEKNGMVVRARDGYRAATDTQEKDETLGNERPELKRKPLGAQ